MTHQPQLFRDSQLLETSQVIYIQAQERARIMIEMFHLWPRERKRASQSGSYRPLEGQKILLYFICFMAYQPSLSNADAILEEQK